jgi:hypothetical protein
MKNLSSILTSLIDKEITYLSINDHKIWPHDNVKMFLSDFNVEGYYNISCDGKVMLVIGLRDIDGAWEMKEYSVDYRRDESVRSVQFDSFIINFK